MKEEILSRGTARKDVGKSCVDKPICCFLAFSLRSQTMLSAFERQWAPCASIRPDEISTVLTGFTLNSRFDQNETFRKDLIEVAYSPVPFCLIAACTGIFPAVFRLVNSLAEQTAIRDSIHGANGIQTRGRFRNSLRAFVHLADVRIFYRAKGRVQWENSSFFFSLLLQQGIGRFSLTCSFITSTIIY